MPKIPPNKSRRGKVRTEHSGVHKMEYSVDPQIINPPKDHACSNDTVAPAKEYHSLLGLSSLNSDDPQFYEKLDKAVDEMLNNLKQLEIYKTTMAMQKEYAELVSTLSPNFIVLANKLALQLYGDQAPSFFLE